MHINFFFGLHCSRTDNLLTFLGLEECKNRKAKQLSGGQRRRLSFAIAISSDSDILACDETTTGLSPDLRRRIWALVSTRRGT